MIKTLTAFTSEIDNVELAVAEILKQIEPEKNLLKNSFGIISCHSEFISLGIVEEVCKNFPFDITGTSTLMTAVPGCIEQVSLTLTIVTSDDIVFSGAVTEPLKIESYKEKIKEAYDKTASAFSKKPAFIFVSAPLIFNIAGDHVVEAIDEVSGGVPAFGTLAVDHTVDYSTVKTIYNGKSYPDTLSMMLIYGDIDPVFSIASVSNEKIFGQKAIITEADENILKGVNGMPVIDYLQSIGLAPNKKIEGLNSIPFIIYFNDGTKPATRAIFAITPEGYAVCGGIMPVNATLGIGYIDHDEVLRTTTQSINDALSQKKNNGLFIFSCLVRNLALGFDVMAEMEAVQKSIDGKIPYFISYSGGEICPVYNEEGKAVNRFHNDTIITCLF
ncbi:MAG: FIST C-terminal domain-containing protein [Endomicrobia bacterium]|nr:FIST C-terminal domain-containing protein [Endomicrobiia bacterium]